METTTRIKLNHIHDNFINGNNKEVVKLINESFIQYDFWGLYLEYLDELYVEDSAKLEYFSKLVITYNRITNR